MFTAEHLHLIYKILEMTGYAGADLDAVTGAAAVLTAGNMVYTGGAGLLLGVG